MEKLSKWLVEIDSLKSKEDVIHNIIQLANHLKPTSIKFIYVSKELDLPADIVSDFPDLQKANQQSIGQELDDLVRKDLSSEITFEIELAIGNPLTEVLKKSQDLDIDLILISNQQDYAKLHKKIIRKSPCSVLVVPTERINDINSILIPVDHSQYTTLSISVAKLFTEQYNVQEVKTMHLYKDASHYLNRVFESPYEVEQLLAQQQELNEKLKSYAVFKTNELIESNKSIAGLTGVTIQLQKGTDVDEHLSQQLNASNPDLIIMGAKGKTASAGNLLGSVTENLQADLMKSLLFVVKKKGENVSFIRSLLNLAS